MWTIRNKATRVETVLSVDALRDSLLANHYDVGYEFRAPAAELGSTGARRSNGC